MRLKKVEEIAEQLQVKKSRLYELTRLGIIPSVRLGRQIRFDPKAIEEWINSGGSNGKEQSDQTLLGKQI